MCHLTRTDRFSIIAYIVLIFIAVLRNYVKNTIHRHSNTTCAARADVDNVNPHLSRYLVSIAKHHRPLFFRSTANAKHSDTEKPEDAPQQSYFDQLNHQILLIQKIYERQLHCQRSGSPKK